MPNLFVANSPLQYLLARLIAESRFSGEENWLLQYVQNGDFSESFSAIDAMIGQNEFSKKVTFPHEDFSGMKVDRYFMSNRYNRTEFELLCTMKGRYQKLCAFEDGFATYLPHYFKNAAIHDGSPLLAMSQILCSLQNAADRLIRGRRARKRQPISCVPARSFDEIYSILPSLPAFPAHVRRVRIVDEFKALFAAPANSQSGEKTCVFLSQSLAEDGLVDVETYRRFTHRVLDRLIGRYDRVYFKSHPREGREMQAQALEMGCELLPPAYRAIPVEFFLTHNPGMAVFGYWSTTLIYASALEISAFSVGRALVDEAGKGARVAEIWRTHSPVMKMFGVGDFSC